MNASGFVLLLTVFRLVLPFGLLMLLGEYLKRQEAGYELKL
jgi:hypothetical protein